MAELKVRIPEDLKRKMEKFEVDWSPAIRRMIEREIQNLTELEKIVSKSQIRKCFNAWQKELIAERFRNVAGCQRLENFLSFLAF